MNNCLYNIVIILFLLAIFNKTNGKETFSQDQSCSGKINKEGHRWNGDDCKGVYNSLIKNGDWEQERIDNWCKNTPNCKLNIPVQQPEQVQQPVRRSEPVSEQVPVQQPQQSGSCSTCISTKISNPACLHKGYRGWDFLGNNVHKSKYNDINDDDLSNVGSLCNNKINENEDRIDIKTKIDDNKEYVLLVLTNNKFMDIKKIKGSDLVNMEKKRGNDRKTVEVQGKFFPISYWKLNFFFEHEKTIEGKKNYIGYSDHEEHTGKNIQNLFILTDNLDVMNMDNNKIIEGLKWLCCDCKLIQWKEVEDSVYNIEKYIPCDLDNIKINKIK